MYRSSKVLFRFVVVLCLFCSFTWGESNFTKTAAKPPTDNLYTYITKKMYTYVYYLDRKLSERLTDDAYILDVESVSVY